MQRRLRRLREMSLSEVAVRARQEASKWVDRSRPGGRTPAESLELFTVLRRANMRLLDRASAEDLKRVGIHSERGEESLEHLRRLYAGHDLLHLNQIARVREAVARLV